MAFGRLWWYFDRILGFLIEYKVILTECRIFLAEFVYAAHTYTHTHTHAHTHTTRTCVIKFKAILIEYRALLNLCMQLNCIVCVCVGRCV